MLYRMLMTIEHEIEVALKDDSEAKVMATNLIRSRLGNLSPMDDISVCVHLPDGKEWWVNKNDVRDTF